MVEKCIIDSNEYCQSGCCDCLLLGIATGLERERNAYYRKVQEELKKMRS